jgi:hypothetical protein
MIKDIVVSCSDLSFASLFGNITFSVFLCFPAPNIKGKAAIKGRDIMSNGGDFSALAGSSNGGGKDLLSDIRG